jgi:type VI secretion system protein ImpA
MLDLETLLAPLSDDAPCGGDLEYDPAFLALEEAGRGKPEQQYGDTIIPAEQPDWRAVREQALALAARTRDVRIAVWLARAGARLGGWRDGVAGLQLLAGLLERHWDHVHPQLDASDGNDPTMRLNALAPLAAGDAGLADFRAAALSGQRGSLTPRELELAFGKAEPTEHESVPTEAGVVQGVAEALAADAGLAEALHGGLKAVQAMVDVIDAKVGAGQGPELDGLLMLVRLVDRAARQATGAADASADADGTAPPGAAGAAPGVAAGPGLIATREDAVRTLERVCEWIERNEPSNPAPLLIRRAQRLMSKSFIDIIRDLVPDGLDQIEKLAGTQGGESQ